MINYTRARCEDLIAAANKNLRENERNIRKFMGISCSASDIGTLILYAETIRDQGTYEGVLMPPRSEVRQLLKKAKLI